MVVGGGVLVEKSGGRYHLDERMLEETDARARRLAFLVSGALAFIGLMLLLALAKRPG